MTLTDERRGHALDAMAVRKRWVRRSARLRPVPPAGEIRLHVAPDFEQAWAEHEAAAGQRGAPPYWARPWPGGLALARYLLDHPELVAGQCVLELGAGSGLCAVAAAKAGAARVLAIDLDPTACAAAELNAAANGVAARFEVRRADLFDVSADGWPVVLAADLWYERFLALRLNAHLRTLAADGALVLVGDPGRAHLPRRGLLEMHCEALSGTDGFEPGASCSAKVYRVQAGDAQPGAGRPSDEHGLDQGAHQPCT